MRNGQLPQLTGKSLDEISVDVCKGNYLAAISYQLVHIRNYTMHLIGNGTTNTNIKHYK